MRSTTVFFSGFSLWILLVPVSAMPGIYIIPYIEKEEAFANPMKGWVVWGEDPIPLPQPCTLFFSYRSWRDLEPVEGQYRFEAWESDVWDYWVRRGMKAVFRVYLDYPGRPLGVPQWLLDAGVKVTPYDEYGSGWSPDYENPLLLEKVKQLIARLGERYDSDPRVAFLDVGILGHWGEWHTYPRDELFASVRVQREVMNAFLAAFPTKKMMLRYPTAWSAMRPFGYHDDCFLTDTDGTEDWMFFNQIRAARAESVWKTQPFGGEFCGGSERAYDGTLEQPEECLRLIREGHFSHLGPAGGDIETQGAEHQRNVDRMLNAMGYRFVIRQAELPDAIIRGQAFDLVFTLENTASAPFYYPWPLQAVWLNGLDQEISATDTGIDIREWLPGQHTVRISLPAPEVPAETLVQLALRIPDPSNQGPPVRFANTGKEILGAFVLGTLRVNETAAVPRWAEQE